MKILGFFEKYRSRIIVLAILLVCVLISVSTYNKNYSRIILKSKNISEVKNALLIVDSFAISESDNCRFTAKVKDCSEKDLKGFNINVYISSDKEYKLLPGDEIMISGNWQIPETNSNLGGFNQKNYYKSKNIHGTIYCKDNIKFLKKGKSSFFRSIASVRADFMENCDEYFPKRYSGLVKGLISGETSFIEDEDSKIFKESGIYHIIAISGMHLNIFIIFVTFFVSKLKLKRIKKAVIMAICSIAVSLFVLVFTGFGLSVLRAFIMLLISLGSGVFTRKYSPKNSLFISTAIILILIPESFYNVGYMLSVLSTYAVLKTTDIVKSAKESKYLSSLSSKAWFGTIITSSLCFVFNLPIMISSFGYLSVYSALANLFALPLSTPSLVLGILFAFFSSFKFTFVSKIFSYMLTAIFHLMTECAHVINKLPYSTIRIYPKNIFYIITITIFVSLCIYLIYKKKFRCFMLASIIFISSISPYYLYTNSLKYDAQIVFADVGQGDCAFIKLPDGKSFMIDCGSTNMTHYKIDEIKNTLAAYNIPKIDAAFVSHYHTDHISGIIELVDDGIVKEVYLPFYYDMYDKETGNNINLLLSAALKTNTKVHYVKEGSNIQYKDARFNILLPKSDMFEKPNDMSAVIKFTYGDISALFAGDVEEASLIKLLNKDIDCDILKVPHHGAENEYINIFAGRTSPDYAVISCGADNVYNHPHKDTVEALMEENCKVLRTDKNGAVRFTFDKKSIKSVQARKYN